MNREFNPSTFLPQSTKLQMKATKNCLRSAVVIMSLIFLTSCSTKVVDVKSPCVSLESGPCGNRHPINDWWLNPEGQENKINS